jgi:thiamine biosynthesis lipoprotein
MCNQSTIRKSRCRLLAAFSLVAALLALTAITGCERKAQVHQWSGQTMGTFYRITLLPSSGVQPSYQTAELRAKVDVLLRDINRSMSTYQADSEISIFNSLKSESCLLIGEDFLTVLSEALAIAKASEGAFNPLVAPLVNRWGFGPIKQASRLPTRAEVESLLELTHLNHISLDDTSGQLCKRNNRAQLDLSAIAKGYAVDRIASLFTEQGFSDYLIDVGGELKVSGLNAEGDLWRLAIEQPVTQTAATPSIHEVVHVTDHAIATSGDYRNFFEHEAQHYSHTINPLTGYPAQHNLVSVTVIAAHAATADAWATALLAAGPEQARYLAVKHELAVYLIERDNGYRVHLNEGSGSDLDPLSDRNRTNGVDDGFSAWHSRGFASFLTQ